ncbi:MAG: gliding motility-associated-like protein [Paraglaciecola sp.]|jgi:gliding motility-associated-like protein
MQKVNTSSTLILTFLITAFFSLKTVAQNNAMALVANNKKHETIKPLLFIQNKKQWHENVLFKTYFLGSNSFFLEKNGFTYLLTHPEDLQKIHDLHKSWKKSKDGISMRHHAYRVRFLNAKESPLQGLAKKKGYHNYFLGNDKSQWSSRVPLFGKVEQKELYNGIALETYSQKGQLKYDLVVAPNADASVIKIEYTGADKLELIDGNLHIHTSIDVMQELAPIAFQEFGNQRQYVDCQYILKDNILSFYFPDDYDKTQELIIDPTVQAATLSGTNGSANFGHSATFDNEGNVYSGGRSFGDGYPTTTGAFQQVYGGGGTDIAVSKYNPDGTNLIYASYLGGQNGDLPHSIITDFNQRLYVYGSSSSTDYPVTGNAYQSTHGGGNDIVVSILSTDGTALVGSSYFGGSESDGVNNSSENSNYGDSFRGEIILDGQTNVYVVSSTSSADFPVTGNAFDQSYNDQIIDGIAQDAVVLKSNSDLSVLYWSTYLGGDDADIGNGIRLDDEQNVYVTGTAGAQNFPTTANAFMSTWPGGNENAYISKISSNGSSLITSTFFGTNNGDEHSYFMDVDELNQVHIYGQTTGNVPVTSGTYFFNLGSSQFLAAFDETLSDKIYSTVIGSGGGLGYDFVPVAFMVDKCNGIYFSGYYSAANLPTTSNAISTNGGVFYLGVLEPDASDLLFGTYYGEADHVDGGTSRFDKGGVVYQGVCSCTGSIMNTLPGAWATTQSAFCDVGVFKIDFEIETVTANGTVVPGTSGCAPFEVDLTYTGLNATEWEWFFPDGTLTTTINANYTFAEAGNYEIPLVVKNPNTCNFTDTIFVQIDVLDGESSLQEFQICDGEDLFLDATTSNATYLWDDGSTSATLVVNQQGTYWVDVMIEGCAKRDSFLVTSLSAVDIELGPDTSVCDIPSIILDVADPAALSYIWQDGTGNSNFTATTSGIYSVEVTDTAGCVSIDEVSLDFGETVPLDLGPDSTLCVGQTTILSFTIPDVTYEWSDGSAGQSYNINEPGTIWLELDNNGCKNRDSIEIIYLPELFPNAEGIDILCANDCNGEVTVAPSGGIGFGYAIAWETGDTTEKVSNLCPATYSVTVTDANGCTGIDEGAVGAPPPLDMTLTLQAVECPDDGNGAIEVTTTDGGVPPYTYSIDNSTFSPINGAGFLSGGTYTVIAQDANGCLIEKTAVIDEPADFVVYTGDDIFIKLGDRVDLGGQIIPYFGQVMLWTPADSLNCPTCPNPYFFPLESGQMNFLVTDTTSGCFRQDSMLIFVEKPRDVFAPNVFSPNLDGTNDFFTIFAGIGVKEVLQMHVFSRWGNLIFEKNNFQPNDVNIGWDGTLNGETLNPNVFVWKAQVRFKDGEMKWYQGDVTLVR